MTKTLTLAVASTLALLGAAHAQEAEHRELGAHEHGASTMNFALSGNTVLIELSAPAHDIVGFEHEPETDADKAAIEQAKATLGDPLTLFVLPADAGCTVTTTDIVHVLEEEHHEEEAAAAAPAAPGAAPAPAAEEHEAEAMHSEFEATYELACANPDALTTLVFDFFGFFPNAEEVELQVITDRGQTGFEVERDEPTISLETLI